MNFKVNFKLKFLALILCFLSVLITIITIEFQITEKFILKINTLCRKLALLDKDYVCVDTAASLVLSTIKGFYHFIFTPLVREKFSLLMFFQFLSSTYYFLLIIIFLYYSNLTKEIKYTIIIYILIVGSALGLIFINDGLLTRQKFTAFFPILLFLYLKTNFNYSKVRDFFYEKLKLLS